MKTDSNDNAIQEQNRALEDLHHLHVDDIGAVDDEISRVELKHDGLSVSTLIINFKPINFPLQRRNIYCLVSALCEHNNTAASILSRIS